MIKRFWCQEIFICSFYFSFGTEVYFVFFLGGGLHKKCSNTWRKKKGKNGCRWVRDQGNMVDVAKSHIQSQWVSTVSSKQHVSEYCHHAKKFFLFRGIQPSKSDYERSGRKLTMRLL